MRFKLPSLRQEFAKLHPEVQLMALHMEQYCLRNFSKDIVITRILEDIPGTTRTHPEGRAVDVRDEYGDNIFYFTKDERASIIQEMNTQFPGDDDYATCVWHSSNGGPHHFHIQITRGDLVLKTFKNAEVHTVV